MAGPVGQNFLQSEAVREAQLEAARDALRRAREDLSRLEDLSRDRDDSAVPAPQAQSQQHQQQQSAPQDPQHFFLEPTLDDPNPVPIGSLTDFPPLGSLEKQLEISPSAEEGMTETGEEQSRHDGDGEDQVEGY
jgi:hypothetical protein